jgi:hypothetical protein
MLQLFHLDVAKVDREMLHMLQAFSEACCKRLFKMLHLFSDVVAIVFYLDVAYVATICFQMF